MSAPLTLISHPLCPYVQRAAIVLMEKGIPFERRDVDLKNKPDWFLAVSPLGKTPVLQVGDDVIFESAVICEFLDDTQAPRMHPDQALERAHHRSWMEFGSALLNAIGSFYNAADAAALTARLGDIRSRLVQIEAALVDGPYFAGERFSIVDAVFAPVFRYFDMFDTIEDFNLLDGLDKVGAWRDQLSRRESVRLAVHPDYAQLLSQFLIDRHSELSRRIEAVACAERTPTNKLAVSSDDSNAAIAR